MLAQFRRPASQARAGRSHYHFKKWLWDSNGKRVGAEEVRPLKHEHADLINTCYRNPAKCSETLFCLGWDLDAHRAEDSWKTKGGKLKWSPIKKLLFEKHPEIFQHIFAVVRSTSGNGLAIFIAISPLELVPSTSKAQRAARALQQKILILLNRYGLGADEGALGLKRDFCNFLNPERCVYTNTFILKAVQASRIPVVRELLRYLNPMELNPYVKKKDREGLLYANIGAERKLAKLYMHLYENCDQDRGFCTGQFSKSELRKITQLSLPFLASFLKNPPEWLFTEYYDCDHEWGLCLKLDNNLTKRAIELIEARSQQTCDDTAKDFSGSLERPELIQDGNRNHWITKATLLLKHYGVPENRASELMTHHVSSIPGSEGSTNCKNVKRIVRSIYANHRDLFGIGGRAAPEWLLSGKARVQTEIKQLASAPSQKEHVNNFQEGGGTPQKLALRKVSEDQCFSWDKNYYSLPKDLIGKQVNVFEWAGKLRVYAPGNNSHVVTHNKLNGCRGKYRVLALHFPELNPENRRDIGIKLYERKGLHIGTFAENLVERYGLFAIRRLWLLTSLIKQYGADTVNQAAEVSSNLSELNRALQIHHLDQKIVQESVQLINAV